MFAYRLSVIIILVLAVLLLEPKLGNTQADGFQMESKRTGPAQKYCGRRLSNALKAICEGMYNTMFKKSDQDMQMSNDYPLTSYEESSSPFIPRAGANKLISHFANRRYRRSRGIYEECCMNACTVNELSLYCA